MGSTGAWDCVRHACIMRAGTCTCWPTCERMRSQLYDESGKAIDDLADQLHDGADAEIDEEDL